MIFATESALPDGKLGLQLMLLFITKTDIYMASEHLDGGGIGSTVG